MWTEELSLFAMKQKRVMLRTALLKEYYISYNEQFSSSVDYELDHRVLCEQITTEARKGQINLASLVRIKMLEKINLIPSESEIELIESLSSFKFNEIINFYQKITQWLNKIRDCNNISSVYSPQSLDQTLANHLVTILEKAVKHRGKVFGLLLSFPLAFKYKFKTFYDKLILKYVTIIMSFIYRYD